MELLEAGQAGSEIEIVGSSKLVAIAAAALQFVSILATSAGFCWNSSLAYIAGAVLTIVNTSVATAAATRAACRKNTFLTTRKS